MENVDNKTELTTINYWAGVFYDRNDNYEIAEIIVKTIKGMFDEHKKTP